MENGERFGGQTHPYPTAELVPFSPNTIVTPEDYRANLERLQKIKAALTFYEEQNNQGLQRYYEEKQALESAVEQGRLAAQRLEQLNAQSTIGVLPAPAVPIAGPSNGALPQALPQYHARTQTYTEVEVPTSAQIVEITSPQVDSHVAGGSSTHANNFYHSQSQQRASHLPQTAHATQHVHPTPHSAGNTNNSQPPQIRTSYAAAASSAPVPQQMSYQNAQWYQNAPSVMYDSRGVPQVQQPSFVQYAPLSTAHRSGGVVPPQPAAPQPSRSEESSGHAQAGQARQPNYQSRYGARTTSSLDGALGTSSGPAPQSVPHAKVTYSSRGNHPAAGTSQPSNPPPQNDRTDQEKQLFAFFQSLHPAIVQQLMVQVLTVVARKQSGRPKSAAEEQADQSLEARLLQASEVIAERLKRYSLVEIKQIFVKYWNLAKISREQADTYSANLRDATSNQHSTQAQSTASTFASSTSKLPAPRATAAPATAQPHPGPSSSRPAASLSTAIPSTSSATISATQRAPRTVTASEHPQLSWYVPRDPAAPVAYRDSTGQLRYVFRPPQTPSEVRPATAAATDPPSEPIFVHHPLAQQPQAPQATTIELPGTPEPVEIQPPSPWSPEKADRSRLAQDIMRSLGRPRGSFGEPLRSASGTPVEVEETHSNSGGKRKSPPSPRPSTPLKRQRAEDPAGDAAASEAVVRPDDVIDLTTSTPEEDTTSEPMRTTPDRDPEPITTTVQPEKSPTKEPGDVTLTLPPSDRETSVVSSESVDLVKVQATFAEPAAPISEASDPPTSAKSSSPPREDLGILDLPSLDEHLFAADTSNSLNALAAPPSFSGTDRERTSSPARGDRVPLFLPSPSSSPGASSSRGASQPASQEEDVPSDDEAAPRALYGHRNKGKRKARQSSVDVDLTSSPGSASPPSRRKSAVFVAVPPLPRYARQQQLRETSPVSVSASAGVSASATASVNGESVDELAEWHDEEDRRTREEEMQTTMQLSYDLMRESPCLWSECGAVLNSMARLQKHAVQHASEHMEWGTYGCQWQNCTVKFTEEAKLANHLRKHASVPLPCAYDGCEKTFNTAEALLAHHHRSTKHRNGTLRARTAPFAPAENRRPLSPLPDVLPAYLSIPRRVSRHPISKERHQWLGPKVLENITAFKYSGGRSNAAYPPRGSRRLAEKVAAAELAGVTPEAALAQIKRWMDEDYLVFAAGYKAARDERCADIPSQEVTQLVEDGLVLWPAEDDQKAAASVRPRAGASSGPEEREDRAADEGADKAASSRAMPRTDASTSGGDGGGADDSEDPGVDQLADDVSDGRAVADGGGRAEEGRRVAAGGAKAKPQLPRRSNLGVGVSQIPSPGPGNTNPLATVAVQREDGASPDRGGGGGGAMQSSSPTAHMQQHIPWPLWPPPPAFGDKEGVV